MQIVRTIIWVLILFAILAFSFFNWQPVEVTLWDNLVLETKVPALVIIAFLLGLMPMWLFHRSVTWSLNRRIRSLENSVKSSALARRHEPPVDGSPPKPAPVTVDKPVESTAKPGDILAPSDGADG
ncbi:LapA family protein [Erythrobacter insulae]|uniref:LapA family protein n=1 Tax=Erythrobacter insulae TaxID=2584124 RepID=A0A547PE44_9SPHN|nr:LapA family protein [Erythrobacter insulae]TRD12399.1 LapA family protein [Erythrobacter insulae]